MEAANIGRAGAREADVAPAPAAVEPAGRVGWSPADPGPLGLAAFAGTTFVLSIINANLVSATALPVVLPLALVYGGLAQFVAGLWEFRTGNTFGAVAFCSFGALYLWMWGIFTTWMFVASLRTTAPVALVFLLLAITFIVLGIGWSALSGTTNTTNGTIKLGGWIGLATAIVAWYASFAAVLNSTFGRTLLPVFPLTRG
jgi:succinate-acetate transporter protein